MIRYAHSMSSASDLLVRIAGVGAQRRSALASSWGLGMCVGAGSSLRNQIRFTPRARPETDGGSEAKPKPMAKPTPGRNPMSPAACLNPQRGQHCPPACKLKRTRSAFEPLGDFLRSE